MFLRFEEEGIHGFSLTGFLLLEELPPEVTVMAVLD